MIVARLTNTMPLYDRSLISTAYLTADSLSDHRVRISLLESSCIFLSVLFSCLLFSSRIFSSLRLPCLFSPYFYLAPSQYLSFRAGLCAVTETVAAAAAPSLSDA